MEKVKIVKQIHIEALKMDFFVWVNPPYELVQRTEEYRNATNEVLLSHGYGLVTLGGAYKHMTPGCHFRAVCERLLATILSKGPKETRWTREGLQQLSSAIGESGMMVLIDSTYRVVLEERARLN